MVLREIRRGSALHKMVAAELSQRKAREMSGRAVALAAVNGSPTSRLVVAFSRNKVLGAANWRVTDEGTKRINTGVLARKRGTGKALVKYIGRVSPGPMWTKSHPQSWGFCEALGMTPGEILDSGHRIYRWTAEEVEEFCS
jgi:hypothetical protein